MPVHGIYKRKGLGCVRSTREKYLPRPLPIDGIEFMRQDLLRGMRVESEDLCARRATEGLFSESLDCDIVFRFGSWSQQRAVFQPLEAPVILEGCKRLQPLLFMIIVAAGLHSMRSDVVGGGGDTSLPHNAALDWWLWSGHTGVMTTVLRRGIILVTDG